MTRKPIVVILAALSLSASAALAEPTGLSSAKEGTQIQKNAPGASSHQADARRAMDVAGTAFAATGTAPESPGYAEAGQSESQPARTHRNSPHPAVLSHSHPVYPIGVPLPPVSLERY